MAQRIGRCVGPLLLLGLFACGPASETITEPQRNAVKVMKEVCEKQGKRLHPDFLEKELRCQPPEPAGDPRP